MDRIRRGRPLTVSGEDAQPLLATLRAELVSARAAALESGSLDPEWLSRSIRWVAEWVSDSALPLIAALGGIARERGEKVIGDK